MTEEVDCNQAITADQRERQQTYLATHPYGEQDENGVDLSLLRANLKLTPTERIEKMLKALELVMEVRRAGEAAGLSHRSRRT